MREEGFAGTDEVRLKVEISVPANQVGRIIGKGGQNVNYSFELCSRRVMKFEI